MNEIYISWDREWNENKPEIYDLLNAVLNI